ncbi:cytochrome b/b6 domain-containing protein [Microbacterium oxydans]|uniref:cytochrome b/b6 domain-containing protein n=1 Tax=Microbacterium sp. B19(2022) TaxID=2914045 RepID=UPI0014315733|nr:cytochrome b/b6 domain-containing protein [Microbacterium sp. B19(2022)]NJI57837.1 cytochrome b/b6 domain-containing protein [Microbacterium sp. B19(2022)]
MVTRMLRRGLPRVPGGEPWPPAAAVVPDSVAPDDASSDAAADSSVAPVADAVVEPVAATVTTDAVSEAETAGAPVAAASPVVDAAGSGGSHIRRGLPRVPGGEPWPPTDGAPATATGTAAPQVAPVVPAPAATSAAATTTATSAAGAEPAAAAAPSPQGTPVAGMEAVSASHVRRGLPRVVGGDPWPPADTVPTLSGVAAAAAAPVVDEGADAATLVEPVAAPEPAAPAAGSALVVPVLADLDTPLPWTRTVWNGRAPRHVTEAPATGRPRPTWPQAIAVLFGAAALGVLAGAAIAFVRALLSFPFMQDFLAAFPGEYEPAIAVEPGFAPWVNWAHFFNMFLIVLIIRSGLQVRTEKRPTVFWTPRGNAKGKISLNLWFHQSLDILWLLNGVIFVVLLFVTGHWVRIVPTSWEVFPNALSAALQYVSFDWPHEKGWNNYNSLQQLAYFVTVFVAAPLAAITGFRMSGLWPKRAEKLSKAYPVEWARALHFPIMLYFVAFIIAHVALVMLTGFLRNLNHMFASQDAVTWTGFWVFILSLVVIALAWVAARPLVLAPIAKVFGKVSGR